MKSTFFQAAIWIRVALGAFLFPLTTVLHGQITYVSQVRYIFTGLGGSSLQSPNFDPFVAHLDAVEGEVTQYSVLSPEFAIADGNVSGSGKSYCSFVFTAPKAMIVIIREESAGSGQRSVALIGPGITFSKDSSFGQFTGLLQPNQEYAFMAECGGLHSASLNVRLEAFPAQGVSFGFQGVLKGPLGRVTGPMDMEFKLFRSETGSIQAGSTFVANAVPVTQGSFSAALEFDDAYDGAERWLEVSLRPSGQGAFETLSPRTRILTAPYARWAFLATKALTADFATKAASATTAASATVASSTPWSGLFGSAAVTTGAINAGWQMTFNNQSVANFRGGVRLADSGFFEISNTAHISDPNFARLSSTGAWSAVSDVRLKSAITPAEGNLEAALRLRPVNFRWRSSGAEDFGLVAQEVRDVLPRLVQGNEEKESLTVNYSQLSVVAIGAIQEQQAEIQSLRNQNDALKANSAAQRRRIDELLARMERLEEALKKSR